MSGICAIVVAAGEGLRFGRPGGKQLAPVMGSPLFTHALRAFDASGAMDLISLVVNPAQAAECRSVLAGLALATPCSVVNGADTRQGSVRNGLASLPDSRIVLIHDGARPMVTPDLITRTVDALIAEPEIDGVIVGMPATDTVKSVDQSGQVVRTEDRDLIWLIQTPQVFRTSALRKAYQRAEADGFVGTDDASVIEHAGGVVRVVQGLRENIKVTVPGDLELVERLLDERCGNR